MKPCSAWCRPHEGVHVNLVGWTHPCEAVKRILPTTQVSSGKWCIPAGHEVRTRAVEMPAESESTQANPEFPYLLLTTAYTEWRPEAEEVAA